ncbi:MAG TPA: DUF72 domain-containing protein [Candidatus Deferrimicrobiaceae bacterium]|nr:DUF72 domain-containing protein [Candidatus Deferrimicrobiaceae bacterium]
MPDLRIGCSGFSYKHWKEVFYPGDVRSNEWLRYYSNVFSTVELNVTFYRLPLPQTFDRWHEETPPGFRFAVKGSRLITHLKKLQDPEEALALFFERVLRLREKLAVILWQFPPSFRVDLLRLKDFLGMLESSPVRNAFEFRNESWITEGVEAVLGRYGAAFCLADRPEFLDDLPATADFVYLRRHGAEGSYAGRYSRKALEKDAKRIRSFLKGGRDVFVYFNNDAFGYAPANARELAEIVGTVR